MCHCTPCSNQPAASQRFSQWRVHPELEGSSLLEHLRIGGYVTAERPLALFKDPSRPVRTGNGVYMRGFRQPPVPVSPESMAASENRKRLPVVVLNRRKPATAWVTALRLNNNQPPKNFICRPRPRFELPSPRATLQGPRCFRVARHCPLLRHPAPARPGHPPTVQRNAFARAPGSGSNGSFIFGLMRLPLNWRLTATNLLRCMPTTERNMAGNQNPNMTQLLMPALGR